MIAALGGGGSEKSFGDSSHAAHRPGEAYAIWLYSNFQMRKRNPNILYLARPFPPLRATACVRTWNIAKYLSRLGWNVTVVTPHPSVWRNIDDPNEIEARIKKEGLRRILTEHWWRWLSPHTLRCSDEGLRRIAGGISRKFARLMHIDSGVGWAKAAAQACSLLTSNEVDVILATGSPFSSFSLANHLSAKLGRPYVLDYRDPWTGNPHATHSASRAVVRREAQLLSNSSAVTIVSPSWGVNLLNRFQVDGKLHVITNGYDPEELIDIQPYAFSHFAVVYAGNFYPPKRVISPVFAALKRFAENQTGQDKEWHFHYYGNQERHVREEACRFGIMERIVLHGTVPRSEVLSAVRGANVAVVISSVDERATAEDKGIVPGKVFETLGLGTPMLLIAPQESDLARIAEAIGSGGRCSGNDIDGIVAFFTKVKSHERITLGQQRAFAWPNIVQSLDLVLRNVIEAEGKSKLNAV
jgi:glycosyltransferase involved in cell wall biosynthesis